MLSISGPPVENVIESESLGKENSIEVVLPVIKVEKKEVKPKRKYTKRAKPKDPDTSSTPAVEAVIKLSTPLKVEPIKTESKPPERIRKAPIQLKRLGKKTKLLLKSKLYAQLQSHFRRRWMKNLKKVPRKSRNSIQDKDTIKAYDTLNEVHSPSDNAASNTVGKPFEDDINDLNPSSDLFASLQVPQVASNSGSMSPTEAFLMSFPVVSGSIGKVSEQLPVSEPTNDTVLVNIFSPREEYSSCRVDSLVSVSVPENTQRYNNPPIYSNKNYDSQQKGLDAGGQFPSNLMGHSLMDMHFDGIAFTFTLTGTTTTPTSTNAQYAATQEKNSPQAINPVRRSSTNNKVGAYPDYTSSLSTDTNTTNSWSYNTKKSLTQTEIHNVPVDSQQSDYGDPQPFSFSLTSSSGSEPKGITSTASLGLVSNGSAIKYNAPFNTFSNSFLAPPPPAQLGPESSHYGTNAFSFQLTSSPNSLQPAYNIPMASLSNDLTTTNPFATPVVATNSKRIPNKTVKVQAKTTEPSKREKTVARKSSVQDKRNENLATNKSHVNWMTDSTRNLSTSMESMDNYSIMTISQSTSNSYLPITSSGASLFSTTHVNTAVPFRDDFTQKSDIFFAHPAGDERFLWNQPPIEIDRSLRQVDFNVPQLLPPPPPLPPPKTELVAVAPSILPVAPLSQSETAPKHVLKNRISGSDYQPNGNYFSVSNLVAPNKKPSLATISMQCSNTSANNWKSSNAVWDIDYSNQQKIVNSPVSSKSYTAEALIGHTSTYPGSMETLKSNKKSKAANVYSVQNCTSPLVISSVDASEGLDFNCNSSGNPFQFFTNDFIQSPAIFPAPPTLPLLSEPLSGMVPGNVSKKSGTPTKQSIGSNKTPGNKRKSHYDGGGSFIFQPNDPVPHQTNYDLSSSSSFFPTPQAPHSAHFQMNSCSDSFNFSENYKISQPFVAPPPIEFNVPSTSSNYSTNYLPNFNLSSICPEINNVNTIH